MKSPFFIGIFVKSGTEKRAPRGFGDFGLRNRHGRDGAQRCRGGVHDRRRMPGRPLGSTPVGC